MASDVLPREVARGECYRLLGVCFYQPEKDFFCQEKVLERLGKSLKQLIPLSNESVQALETAFSKYAEEELIVDYARLFVGPNELLAAPFGSVYLDEGRRVMGDSTLEVIKIYREEGLILNPEYRNLPDHITAEMEFMYFLIWKEIAALQEGDFQKAVFHLKRQQLFLDNILKRWIGPFCYLIRQGAATDFYKLIADFTEYFIKADDPNHFAEELNCSRRQ